MRYTKTNSGKPAALPGALAVLVCPTILPTRGSYHVFLFFKPDPRQHGLFCARHRRYWCAGVGLFLQQQSAEAEKGADYFILRVWCPVAVAAAFQRIEPVDRLGALPVFFSATPVLLGLKVNDQNHKKEPLFAY
ncbi:hypothetical protein SDC9_151728 [bioreactor metagenome]|uniref:Uncharacterized protein n=1 Tax=bioreactor metagenome TaxID=1076179 RepID=A0A645ERM5_9ZZZZ